MYIPESILCEDFTKLCNVVQREAAHMLVWVQGAPVASVARGVAGGVALQLALAAPFLAAHPWSYVSRAFEFSRCEVLCEDCSAASTRGPVAVYAFR